VENNPEQPLNQQPPAQQPPIAKKNYNSKKIFWIFFVASFLIAFIAGGFFLRGKQNIFSIQKQQKTTISPNPLPTEASTKTGDPTANWKTYASSRFNIEFKYPPELKLQENTDNVRILQGTGYIFEVGKIDNIDMETWISSQRQIKIVEGIPPYIISKAEFKGRPAYYLKQATLAQVPMDRFAVQINNYLLTIAYEVVDNLDFYSNPSDKQRVEKANANFINTEKVIIDQILSAFKFTDQNQQTAIPTITQFARSPTLSAVTSPEESIKNNGILSGNYCHFDYRNYLEKENVAKTYFNFCEKNMPQIAGKLGIGMDGRRVNLKYDGSISAYAQVDEDSIVFKNWLVNTGFLLHEGVHFVQNYGNKASSREWVMEGLADMVRFELTKVSDEPGWAIGCRTGEGYTFGYGCTAAFFIWMENYCEQSDIQIPLNRMIIDGTDTNVTFNNLCRKNVDELWVIYKTTNPPERIYPQR
jgi:hypothetical protein